MGYILLVILIVVVSVLLLRVRLRFEFSPDRKYLFVGLGRTGGEYSLSEKSGVVRISGIPVKRFHLGKDKDQKAVKSRERDKKIKKKRAGRKRPLKMIMRILPGSTRAIGKYAFRLLNALIIEDMRAEIEAGFPSPAVTGKAFGYYQAAIATMPRLSERLVFRPIWTGPGLTGAAYGSIALPLYKVIYLTSLLVFSLPLRELIKLAIGTKEGGQDGK